MKIDLDTIENRLSAASGNRWALTNDGSGLELIAVTCTNGRMKWLKITRDHGRVIQEDFAFIAHARCDIRVLLAHLRGSTALTSQDLEPIEARLAGASPGPWVAFTERDGGIGGCNVISVANDDDEPDLYLWLDDKIAPDEDYEFVAHAREDIPALLESVKVT